VTPRHPQSALVRVVFMTIALLFVGCFSAALAAVFVERCAGSRGYFKSFTDPTRSRDQAHATWPHGGPAHSCRIAVVHRKFDFAGKLLTTLIDLPFAVSPSFPPHLRCSWCAGGRQYQNATTHGSGAAQWSGSTISRSLRRPASYWHVVRHFPVVARELIR